MKKMKRILALFLAVMLVAALGLTSVMADTTSYNSSTKVSFKVGSSKQGYVFTAYRVADVATTQPNPYEISYEARVSEIAAAVDAGSTSNALAALDAIPTSQLVSKGAVSVGSYDSSTATTKNFTNLAQGIYYIRATTTPAGVKSVTNSLFALPYYKNSTDGWTYTLGSTINLGTKVSEDAASIDKTITNSTISGQTEYTEAALGDTVHFQIDASVLGSIDTTNASNDFRLKAYKITDNMDAGLTYKTGTVTVTLLDTNKAPIGNPLTLTTDYTTTVTGGNGEETQIVVALTNAYLQAATFYSGKYVRVEYDAVLNENAVKGYAGNENKAKLGWTNRDNVSSETAPDDAWVYTYGVMVGKTTDDDVKLPGATFEMYATQADADAQSNAFATGTSNDNGEVFFTYKSGTNQGKPVELKSGTYYIKETAAPSGYNRNTLPITVTIAPEYKATFSNNTWADTSKTQTYTPDGKFTEGGNSAAVYPANYKFFTDHVGYVGARVANSKVVLPQTGGIGSILFYSAGALFLIAGAVVVALGLKKRRASSSK